MDTRTAARVATLARLELTPEELNRTAVELTAIVSWLEQLNKPDVSGVEPMSHPIPLHMPLREDVADDGGHAEALAAVAPKFFCGYYAVPKVIE